MKGGKIHAFTAHYQSLIDTKWNYSNRLNGSHSSNSSHSTPINRTVRALYLSRSSDPPFLSLLVSSLLFLSSPCPLVDSSVRAKEIFATSYCTRLLDWLKTLPWNLAFKSIFRSRIRREGSLVLRTHPPIHIIYYSPKPVHLCFLACSFVNNRRDSPSQANHRSGRDFL